MFRALGEIEAAVRKQNKNYYEVILEDDCKEQGITKEASFEKMEHMYQMMQEADLAYDKKQYSASGLVGTDGEKMAQARVAKTVFCIRTCRNRWRKNGTGKGSKDSIVRRLYR